MNRPSINTLEQLTALVKRVEQDHKYMAWVLSSYQHKERLSNARFLEKFELSFESFLRLALCVYPESDSPNFHRQVQQISMYCNIDIATIVNIIRHVEALDALSSSSPIKSLNNESLTEKPMLFAAARDNEEVDDKPDLLNKDAKSDTEDDNAVE